MELQIEKVNKSFGSKHVLKGISFTVQSGYPLGLLGRNGAGKSTTIRIIMDLFPADSGAVTIDGKPSKQFLNKIGYLPEERGLYPKRLIADQMAYIGELRGMKAADARSRALVLLKRLNAEEFYKKKLTTLSKGNQQKIQLAIALINDPEIIILDEPFSGLDPINAKMLKDLVSELAKEGRLVLFSSHEMGHVEEFCNEICIMRDGQVSLAGNLRQIKKSYARNKILITAANEDILEFHKQINGLPEIKRIAKGIAEIETGCIITLHDEKDKSDLFNVMGASGLDVDSFRVIEPTLEEIFVEKAGGTDETV